MWGDCLELQLHYSFISSRSLKYERPGSSQSLHQTSILDARVQVTHSNAHAAVASSAAPVALLMLGVFDLEALDTGGD